MAESFLTIEQVSKELQLNAERIMTLVKKGEIRAFLDQGVHKFRKSDIEEFRKKLEGGHTAFYEGPGAEESAGDEKSDTSKIDLADIDAEPGADESDQTSVLARTQEGEDEAAKEETPEFDFSEEDLGLSLEEQPTGTVDPVETADQTSLLPAAAEEDTVPDDEPAFEFDEKSEDQILDAEGGDSVLVADESESSLDILEVADESSSESDSSASDVPFAEESSSEDAATVAEVEEGSDEPVAAVAAGEKGDTVVDILGETDDGTEDGLETIDLEEVVETQETPVEEGPAAVAEEGAAPETVEVAPPSAEPETVGIAAEVEEATQLGAEEAGVLTELPEEVLEPEGEAEEFPHEAPAMAGAWTIVVPSVLGNAFLCAAIILLAFGGFILLCEIGGISNVVTEEVIKLVKEYASAV